VPRFALALALAAVVVDLAGIGLEPEARATPGPAESAVADTHGARSPGRVKVLRLARSLAFSENSPGGKALTHQKPPRSPIRCLT
jgi:hypothetical protein